ncbi:P-loop containing nucleoside triphosphate hydrolase protein [Xylariaceae sp. FL0255]|nr:P-loop containing nucleoside triphosphate hydrolase protein [Xylariaceae sp. FL0255]
MDDSWSQSFEMDLGPVKPLPGPPAPLAKPTRLRSLRHTTETKPEPRPEPKRRARPNSVVFPAVYAATAKNIRSDVEEPEPPAQPEPEPTPAPAREPPRRERSTKLAPPLLSVQVPREDELARRRKARESIAVFPPPGGYTRRPSLAPISASAGGYGRHSMMAPDDLLRKLEQMLGQAEQNDGADPFIDTLNTLTGVENTNTTMERNTTLESSPMVRDCNWEQFKNRYPDETRTPAIEVLLAHDDLLEQIETEQLRRLRPDQRVYFEPTATKASTTPVTIRKKAANLPIERVRINSAIILGYLSKVTGAGPWVGAPHTFLAPFRTLIHFHKQMEEETRTLRSILRREVEPEKEEDPFSFLGDSELQLMMRTRKAYEEMNCYVNFVNTRLLPRYNMFTTYDSTRPLKIRYRDVALLFRPGELVVEPGVISPADKRSTRIKVAEPRVWRVCYISEDTPHWTVNNLDAPGGKLHGQMDNETEATNLRLYYIDFDGQRYSAVRSDASIGAFEGEKEITKLPFYPLRFHKDSQRLLRDLQERGKRFHDITSGGNKTLSYQGLTLAKDPSGRDIPSKSGQDTTWPEYVESEVIVDFYEAFQMHPWWKPDFQQFPAFENYVPSTTRDEFPIVHWTDRSRSGHVSSSNEMVVDYDGVEELEWAEFMKTDNFVAPEESRPLDHLCQRFSSCDLALLPSRLFVYAFRNRSFINADIRLLKSVPEIQSPLENLQLPEKLKTMIQSSVFGHLEKKKIQRRATLLNSQFMDQDIIRGKGQGLAILLHGPPGVGKTATAEAVAQFYEKPLFPISAGDLGTDPGDVESNLSEIFRLANLWDCILLFDEAETLLAQRDMKDDNATKSSVVSVFLRTLEYYSGILFLTTNRPGIMDEAVKSRMQVSLQYPRLGLIETLAIFQTNIDRLMDIEYERSQITDEPTFEVKSDGILAFAAAHFHRHEGSLISPPWNGRQIRNAFQIAPSIARYEHAHRPGAKQQQQQQHNGSSNGSGSDEPYIGPEHFEKVEETTAETEPSSATSAPQQQQQQQQQIVYRSTDSETRPMSSRSFREPREHSPPQRTSPTRSTTAVFPPGRRGLRTSRFSGESQHQGTRGNNPTHRYSGEFHSRQRSSSSVMPLYLTHSHQHSVSSNGAGGGFPEELNSGKSFLREPSPPYTPELTSVPDNGDRE